MSTGRATDERLTRWRLVLGEAAEAALPSLVGEDQNLDRVLGELYEARGNVAQARAYYAKFVDLWNDADPVLQPAVRDIRNRLARLTAERLR